MADEKAGGCTSYCTNGNCIINILQGTLMTDSQAALLVDSVALGNKENVKKCETLDNDDSVEKKSLEKV